MKGTKLLKDSHENPRDDQKREKTTKIESKELKYTMFGKEEFPLPIIPDTVPNTGQSR